MQTTEHEHVLCPYTVHTRSCRGFFSSFRHAPFLTSVLQEVAALRFALTVPVEYIFFAVRSFIRLGDEKKLSNATCTALNSSC